MLESLNYVIIRCGIQKWKKGVKDDHKTSSLKFERSQVNFAHVDSESKTSKYTCHWNIRHMDLEFIKETEIRIEIKEYWAH